MAFSPVTDAKSSRNLLPMVVESPYAGDVERNVKFAENVCRHFVKVGYAPMASHLLYTRFLDDTIPEERELGIEAGLAWARHGTFSAFCIRPDEQFSRGMHIALDRCLAQGRAHKFFLFSQEGELLGESGWDPGK
jgi:hypothetical protein